MKLNSEKEEVGRFSELIKPKVYKNINHITGSIVHLKIGELNQARSFEMVMKEFLTWCGEDYIFCT